MQIKFLHFKSIFIAVLFIVVGVLPLMGVTNLYINGVKDATIYPNASFEISFDFGPSDSVADVKIWLDNNKDGVPDSLIDFLIMDSAEENERMYDNDYEDLDSLIDGSYRILIDEFWPISDVKYIIKIHDSGGFEMVTLQVDTVISDLTISGTVIEPENQPYLFIMAVPFLKDSVDQNTIKEKAKKLFSRKNIFSTPKINDDDDDDELKGFGALTNNMGEYSINIPDSLAHIWLVFALDAFGMAPGYFSPEPQMIILQGSVTDIDFKFNTASVIVEGDVLDNNGNHLIDDSGYPLDFEVIAENVDDYDFRFKAEIDSSHYTLYLQEGNYNICVKGILPFYLPPFCEEIFADSSDEITVNFACYQPNTTITGKVTILDERPVRWIEVFGSDGVTDIGWTATETDSLGYFELPVSTLSPEWHLHINMDYFPPDMMVEGGNFRAVAPGSNDVHFNIVKLEPAAQILKIQDIRNDQGLQVRVAWHASPLEQDKYDGDPVNQYSLWRLAPIKPYDQLNNTEDNMSVKNALSNINKVITEDSTQVNDRRFIWDFIELVPAIDIPVYAYVAPTLGDSTMHGIYWSYFVVVAHTKYDERFFYSKIDSGYSIDNLRPPKPVVSAEITNSAIVLQWEQSSHDDVIAYHIFRSENSGFEPAEQNEIGITAKNNFEDYDISSGKTYYYRVVVVDDALNKNKSDEIMVSTSNVALVSKAIPTEYRLNHNYPNPFNPVTTINYQIPEAGFVNLVIYNVLGERVKTLVNKHQNAGYYRITWESDNEAGEALSSGIYLYQLEVNNFKANYKMTLSR